MARFGFSGDLGNVDTLTGLGWSFEGFAKGKGGKKELNLSGSVESDGSFEESFRARGKKVKGWLNSEDIHGDGIDASFSYQGKTYDFNPGNRIKLKMTKKGRFKVVDHDLSLEREQTAGPDGGSDPVTGDTTSSQQFRDWLSQLDTNGDGVFNSRDLMINPGQANLLREAELSPGAIEELAQQEYSIGSLADYFRSPSSGFNTQELVNIFNQDVINPPTGLLDDPSLGGVGLSC